MKKKSKMTVGMQLLLALGLMFLSVFIVGACGYLMRNNSVEVETELYNNYGETQGEAAMGFAEFQNVKVQLRNILYIYVGDDTNLQASKKSIEVAKDIVNEYMTEVKSDLKDSGTKALYEKVKKNIEKKDNDIKVEEKKEEINQKDEAPKKEEIVYDDIDVNDKIRADEINNETRAKVRKNSKAIIKEILEWVLCLVIAYVLYLIINYFVGTISGVKQVSMLPTTKENDRLIISRPTIFKRDLKYGDIVTFEAPLEDDLEVNENNIPAIKLYEKFNFQKVGLRKKYYNNIDNAILMTLYF